MGRNWADRSVVTRHFSSSVTPDSRSTRRNRSIRPSARRFSTHPAHIGVDPSIAKLFATYPKPNSYLTGDGLNTASYAWNPTARIRGPNFMARADHQINANNSVFFRALWGSYNTLGGDPLNSRP